MPSRTKRRPRQSSTYTLYEVCDETFDSISGMMGSRKEALRDYRRLRKDYPEACLCKVVWTRLGKQKKGGRP